MSGVLPPGHVVKVPEFPGRWQVWSQSNETPGAYFFVPFNDEAREAGVKYLVAKVISKKNEPFPVITVIRAGWGTHD